MGRIGQQPAREVLQPDESWPASARNRNRRLAAHLRCDRQRLARNLTVITSRLRSLVRNFTGKTHVERDLSDELAAHVDLLADEKMKAGMSEADARRAALVELGGVEQVKEEVRAGRAGLALETFMMDVRYGFRALVKKPGFTLTAVIALALGIGANTAMFSVINGVLLRSLSYANPDQLVMLWERNVVGTVMQNVVSPANFLDWQRQSTSFAQMAAVWDLRANLTGGSGEPEEIKAQFVSHTFFPALGVQPITGRVFLPEEDRAGNDLVIILSHQLWQTRFGGDPAVIGKE